MTDAFSPYLLNSSIYVAEQGELTPVKVNNVMTWQTKQLGG